MYLLNGQQLVRHFIDAVVVLSTVVLMKKYNLEILL